MCILKSTKYNNGDTRHGHFMECLISDCFQGSNYYVNQCRRVLMPILLYLESFFCMYVVQSNRQGCFTDTEVISQLFRYVTKAKIERNLYNSQHEYVTDFMWMQFYRFLSEELYKAWAHLCVSPNESNCAGYWVNSFEIRVGENDDIGDSGIC